jgi:hypothetical protein
MPSDYPAEVEVRSSEGQATRYHLAPEFYARASSTPLSPDDRLVQKLDEDFVVFEGPAPASALADGSISPVYRAQPSGMFAIPTGRLWVRFAEGIDAEEKRGAMAKAGFNVDEAPPWAKHAAWLRASSGKIAEALSAAHHLRTLDGVEHVEPQMLVASARKTQR